MCGICEYRCICEYPIQNFYAGMYVYHRKRKWKWCHVLIISLLSLPHLQRWSFIANARTHITSHLFVHFNLVQRVSLHIWHTYSLTRWLYDIILFTNIYMYVCSLLWECVAMFLWKIRRRIITRLKSACVLRTPWLYSIVTHLHMFFHTKLNIWDTSLISCLQQYMKLVWKILVIN